MGQLQFVDGFEHYGSVSLESKWTQPINLGGQISSAGRNGKCLEVVSGGGMGKTLNDFFPSMLIAFAIKVPNTFGNNQLVIVRSTGTEIVRLRTQADGTLNVQAANGNILFTTSFSIKSNQWYFFELKVDLSGSSTLTADAELRIDGDVKGSGSASTGITIANLVYPHAEANNFELFYGGVTGPTYYDDLYVLGDSSTISYRGDMKILAIYPNGDFTPNAWTPVGTGTDHYTYINEHAPDDDGTYLKSNNVNDAENFDWEDVAASVGTIFGYQYSVRAMKDNENSRAIRLTEGADPLSPAQESDTFYLNDNYIYFTYCIDDNITAATFNARQHGFYVHSIP